MADPSTEPIRRGRRYKTLWNNVVTVAGTIICLLGIVLLLTFGLFSLISPTANPYVDIFGYLVIPAIILAGGGLMLFGILFRAWRIRRQDPSQKLTLDLPSIDLREPRQRRTVFVGMGLLLLLLPVIGVSSYHGYHFTDSTDFCAEACHTVMEPQGTTYQSSAHARVSCAECHIGSGASWFVKSKLSGTRQVLAVVRSSYSRPIPPAIHHLRPATETCEQCHWPQKFFGAQLMELTHFGMDRDNSRRDIRMLVKTGGGDEAMGRAEGIHMHMTLAGSIEYIAVDESLQDIPWVKWTNPNGTELIYRTDGKQGEDPPEGNVRRIDCMDCHNRPAHKFRSPSEAIDQLLATGRIDQGLPYVKAKGMELLDEPYPDLATATMRIANGFTEYYRSEHPEVWSADNASVMQAIDGIQQIYRTNFFPEMKVDWKTYPDNIGHLYFPGCFRCHDGGHINQFGDSISTECSICHTFLEPSEDDPDSLREEEFVHRWKVPGLHEEVKCYQCHGKGRLDRSCEGCHSEVAGFRAGKLEGFELEADIMQEVLDCETCHDLSEPVTLEVVDVACLTCHEDYEGLLASWAQDLDDARRRSVASLSALEEILGEKTNRRFDEERHWLRDRREILNVLDRAKALHNPIAAEEVYAQVTREATERAQALNFPH